MLEFSPPPFFSLCQRDKDFFFALYFSPFMIPPQCVNSSCMSHGNAFLCIMSIRQVFNCGFIIQDFDCNLVSKGDVPGFWMSSENHMDLRLTFEANRSPLQTLSGSLFCHVVQVRNRGCFPEKWQENLKTFCRTPRTWGIYPNWCVLQMNLDGSCVASASLTWGAD